MAGFRAFQFMEKGQESKILLSCSILRTIEGTSRPRQTFFLAACPGFAGQSTCNDREMDIIKLKGVNPLMAEESESMKITDPKATPRIVKMPETRAPESRPKNPSRKTDTDPVSLSPQARAFIEAQRSLAEIPDVREDKVAEVKARIEAGTYTIDSEKIAEKMIREALGDKE